MDEPTSSGGNVRPRRRARPRRKTAKARASSAAPRAAIEGQAGAGRADQAGDDFAAAAARAAEGDATVAESYTASADDVHEPVYPGVTLLARDAGTGSEAGQGGERVGRVGQAAVNGDAGLAAMLDEAAASPLADAPAAAPAAAMVHSITAADLPGMCMGASMLASLGMLRIGFAPLTEAEANALTGALIKNLQAWEVKIDNPKVAAGLDLGGCLIAILAPRIIADLKRAPAPAAQAPANDGIAAAA